MDTDFYSPLLRILSGLKLLVVVGFELRPRRCHLTFVESILSRCLGLGLCVTRLFRPLFSQFLYPSVFSPRESLA